MVTRFLALTLCLTLGFCATWPDDPVQVVDPAAFGFPIATFATLPF